MSDTTESPSPQPGAGLDKRPEAILGRPEIPSDDVPVVIDVSHVQMIFNMASEELGSLKEYFIKIARHELFFKEFKQTCQVRDFIGYNERAVKWQVWIGLVVHLLLRFVKFGSKWELSFSRLAGVVRCAVWVRRELFAVLAVMGRKRGTAGAGKTADPSPRPLISQGFLDFPQQNLGQQAA